MSTKKILVAELEVELQTLQLEELDVHEWDIYTFPLTYAQFKLMFYSQEGDPNSFSFAPYPPLKNTTGYDQEELQRQNWVATRASTQLATNQGGSGASPARNWEEDDDSTGLVNYFQLGGRKRNTTVSEKSGTEQYGQAEGIAYRFTEDPDVSSGTTVALDTHTQNAYFIGDPLTRKDVKNFWAEEVIMNQMETDLALSREHWTETSKHKIQQELDFLVFGDAKVNFSRDLASLEEEIVNAGARTSVGGDNSLTEAKKNTVSLLLVLVVTNPHTGIKNNHLNIHFKVRTAPGVSKTNYEKADAELDETA
jgi:hypothetical protein